MNLPSWSRKNKSPEKSDITISTYANHNRWTPQSIRNSRIGSKTLLFHDISFPRGRLEAPEKEHIQQALDFSKGKDKLLVACQVTRNGKSGTGMADCGR